MVHLDIDALSRVRCSANNTSTVVDIEENVGLRISDGERIGVCLGVVKTVSITTLDPAHMIET